MVIAVPVFEHSDKRGKYFQYGPDGEKHYVADWGEPMAIRKAEGDAPRQFDSKEKETFSPINGVEMGFEPNKGKYYRWGFFGTKYYVNQLGEQKARNLARNERSLERIRP